MRARLAFSLVLLLLICAECQEPDDGDADVDVATRKYADEALFRTTESTDINTTLSSTEIENNSTASDHGVGGMKENDNYDDDQANQGAPGDEENGYWTTLPPEDDYAISMKDVFEKSLDVVKDEMKGIGIIQSWLKEQAGDLGLGATENDLMESTDYTEGETPEMEEVYNEESDLVEETPEDVPEISEDVSEIPEDVSEIPGDISEIPEGVSEIPENGLEIPEGVPEISKDIPEISEVVTKIPDDISEIPEGTQTEFMYTQSTEEVQKSTEQPETTTLSEGILLEKIEDDLEKLNKVNEEELKEVKERSEIVLDIEKSLNELEMISSHETTVVPSTTESITVLENDVTTEVIKAVPSKEDSEISTEELTGTTVSSVIDAGNESGILKEFDFVVNSNSEIPDLVIEEVRSEEEIVDMTTEFSIMTTDSLPEVTKFLKGMMKDIDITEDTKDTEEPRKSEKDDEQEREKNEEDELNEDDKEDDYEREEDATEFFHITNEIEMETTTTSILEISSGTITEEATIDETIKDTVSSELTITPTSILDIEEDISTIPPSTIPPSTFIPQTETTFKTTQSSNLPSTSTTELPETTITEKVTEMSNVPNESSEDLTTFIDFSTASTMKTTTTMKITTEKTTSATSTTTNKQITNDHLTTVKIESPNDIVDEIVDEIIDEIKTLEDETTITSTTIVTTSTQDPTIIILEETLNLTKTVDDLLNENDKILNVLTSNVLNVSNEDKNSEDSDQEQEKSLSSSDNDDGNNENEDEDEEEEDEEILNLDDFDKTLQISNEYLPSNVDDIDVVEDELDSSEQDHSDDIDQAIKLKEEVTAVSTVPEILEPQVSAVIIDRMDRNVCLNASGLSIKIAMNNSTYWVPSTARVLGECTSFGAFLNFTWRPEEFKESRNITLGFKFIGDEEESYIEKVIFQTPTETLLIQHLETYFMEPTIINLTKDATLTISHMNIQLNQKLRDYATVSLLSVDNTLALQIASGGLCLFVVVVAVAIYSYRKLRSQERIFKVSMDK